MKDTPDHRQPEFMPSVYLTAPELTRGKNIVVCADGTGNADVKGRGSNVFKLFEAVDTTRHLTDLDLPRQIAFYDEGVGTENWWPKRVVGGAFGVGLAANIRDLYRKIAQVYQPGDRLYLFGFSRGALTVRVLAAFIDACGIVDADHYAANEALSSAVTRCWGHFRARIRHPDAPSPADLKCRARDTIEFVGVWDTVDAVGLPDYILRQMAALRRWLGFRVDVSEPPSSVRYACHALALDEPRKAFAPVLWNQSANIEQVWFAGAHSDVGGGYPRHGLSLIPLHWMMKRAEARGLRFVGPDDLYYDGHQIVADKLHDPRSGLAMYYRWQPRDVEALCDDARVHPQFHISVFDRIAQGVDGYAPINIAPQQPVIAFTERRDWRYLRPEQLCDVLSARAGALRQLRAGSANLLRMGDVSYWLFLAASVVGVICGVLLGLVLLGWKPFGGLAASGAVLACGALLALAAWILAKATDSRLDAAFSKQWHAMRKDLLKALSRTAAPDSGLLVKGISSPPR